MELKREDILDALIKVLQEIQKAVVDKPEPIGEETVPIGDLCEFDSLASVEATVNALVTLGFEEFPSYPSIFISKDNEALTLGQVASRIQKIRLKRK